MSWRKRREGGVPSNELANEELESGGWRQKAQGIELAEQVMDDHVGLVERDEIEVDSCDEVRSYEDIATD